MVVRKFAKLCCIGSNPILVFLLIMYSIRYLKEIKYRFYYLGLSLCFCFVSLWLFSDQLLYFCCLPLHNAYSYYYGFLSVPHFLFTEINEPLICRFIVVMGVLFYWFFFFFIYQLWCYIENTLFFYERKIVLKIMKFSLGLFVLSNFFLFSYILPFACKFFVSLEVTNSFFGENLGTNKNIHLEIKMLPYICFIFKTVGWFNLFFQFPIFMYILIYLKKIDGIRLVKWRRYFYFVFFIISIFITIDIFSQFIFLFIFVTFYAMTIFYTKFNLVK